MSCHHITIQQACIMSAVSNHWYDIPKPMSLFYHGMAYWLCTVLQ